MESNIHLEVVEIRRLNGDGKTKAFCDLSVYGTLLVRGFRVVEGKNGPFVGMPRRQGRDGQWYEVITPLNDDAKARLNETVLEAYQDGNGSVV